VSGAGGAVKIFCTCGSIVKVFFIEHEKGTGEPLDNNLFLGSFYCGHWRFSSGTSFANSMMVSQEVVTPAKAGVQSCVELLGNNRFRPAPE